MTATATPLEAHGPDPSTGPGLQRHGLDDAALRQAAVVAAAILVGCSVVAGALALVTAERVTPEPGTVANLLVGTTWTVAGLVVVRAQPRNACGWVLLLSGWLGVVELCGQYAVLGTAVVDGSLPAVDLAAWVAAWGWSVYVLVLPLFLLLVPTGHLPSPRWRPVAGAVLLVWLGLTLALAVAPGPLEIHSTLDNPWVLPAARGSEVVVAVMSWAAGCITIPAAALALARRMWGAARRERSQLRWLVLAGPAALVVVPAALITLDVPGARQLYVVTLLGPPVGTLVAAMRLGLLDVEAAVSRVVVTAVIALMLVTGWLAVVDLLGPELLRSRSGAVMTALLAVVAVVAGAALQQLVDRWWFPHRLGVRVLVGRIGAAAQDAREPRDALVRLVASAARELRLDGISFVSDAVSTATGTIRRGETVDAIALGRRVGSLTVDRGRRGPLPDDERLVLERVGTMAATLAHATALAAEAERGRSTVALAREDERRRLRRDLDGRVEPAVEDALRQARRLVDETSGDPGADRLLDHLEDAAGHLRSVTDGLRLPVLDRHGLGGALATLVHDLGPVAGRAEVEPLPALPAATEVAAYVVAAEAVANALTHAAAATVVLRARVAGGVLEVEVEDDGRGLPPRPRLGVGLTSARQRAAEIGGTVEHAPASPGGTLVVLRLPAQEVSHRA